MPTSTRSSAPTTPRRKYSARRPREERREQLLDAALGLIDEQGFDRLTIEGVARRAGLAKTVVYDTFGSREELLRRLLTREQERALAALEASMPVPPLVEDPRQVLTEALTALLESVRKSPETWRLTLLPPEGTPPAVRKTVDRQRELLIRRVEPIVAWGLDRIGAGQLDTELATHSLVATCEQAIRLTLTDPDRFRARRLADFAADLVATIGKA
ncbi:MAG TPA: helix-turn-helix domain-containing protein [Thermoleophilaceae bacterium]|nr:helix-turn-helix domain-containing protein [Thermoleophilaceae bacterium]